MNNDKRYQSHKIRDRKSVFLKTLYRRKIMFREFILHNKFDKDFDEWKYDHVKLEKFIKISNKECFLTICSNQYKYFFMAIEWRTKDHFLFSIYKKPAKKLLSKLDNSFLKVSQLLRIKNGTLIIK